MKGIERIILKPIITERSTLLREKSNKFVFEVDTRANKREIRLAVEKLFNVKVRDVKTLMIRGKPKTTFMRAGRFTGKRSDRKKAIVKLSQGETIDIFDQV